MIEDFFTNPLGGAKFRRFGNIIVNCETDEYGPVNADKLTATHFKRVDGFVNHDGSHVKVDGRDSEPTSYGSQKMKLVSSKECVGKPTDTEWAWHRMAHQKVGGHCPSPLIDSHTNHTCAKIVAE